MSTKKFQRSKKMKSSGLFAAAAVWRRTGGVTYENTFMANSSP
jgi:hypothetical protein